MEEKTFWWRWVKKKRTIDGKKERAYMTAKPKN